MRLKKQDSGPSFLLVFLFALPLARQLTELLVQAPLEVGTLGGIQGFVLGATPGVQEPFPADPLPCVGLGLLPTAMHLGQNKHQKMGLGSPMWEPRACTPQAWNSFFACLASPQNHLPSFTAIIIIMLHIIIQLCCYTALHTYIFHIFNSLFYYL